MWDSRKYDNIRGKQAILFINLFGKGLTQEINGDGGSDYCYLYRDNQREPLRRRELKSSTFTINSEHTQALCGGIRGLRNHTTDIWPLPYQLSGKIYSALHCKIIDRLQLLTLCLLFCVNGADHSTFDGLFWLCKICCQAYFCDGTCFSFFDVYTSPSTQCNLYFLFQVFLQNTSFPFFFTWKLRYPPRTPSKVLLPDLSYPVTLCTRCQWV